MGATMKDHSIDWASARLRYEKEAISVRALARELKTSDTAILRKAKAENWVRYATGRGLQQALAATATAERPWSFKVRRDALATALAESRRGVKTVEDSIYADMRVWMALTALGAAPRSLPGAIELSEDAFGEIFGKAYVRFARQFSAGPNDADTR
jgi:hypothetical protein